MENLSFEACWAKLAATPVGRLAVMVRGDPEVFPLNFVVDGRSIVFRTDEGTKVIGLRRDSVVSFEVDAIDPDGQSGWSVIVKGTAAEVLDADERRRVGELPLKSWTLGDKAHYFRISPTEVTGREIHSGAGIERIRRP